MLGTISHTSIRTAHREPAPRRDLRTLHVTTLYFCSLGASFPSLPQEQLQYSTGFSSVNRRVLKFTKEAKSVHSLIKIQAPARMRTPAAVFSVRSSGTRPPRRVRGSSRIRPAAPALGGARRGPAPARRRPDRTHGGWSAARRSRASAPAIMLKMMPPSSRAQRSPGYVWTRSPRSPANGSLRLGQIQLSRAEQLLNIMRPPSARAFPAQPETARRSRHCSWGTPGP